jgi:hypothetical protein
MRLQRDPEELLLATPVGDRLRRENGSRRVLQPAAVRAGVPWVAFRTFRHTSASLLFAEAPGARCRACTALPGSAERRS